MPSYIITISTRVSIRVTVQKQQVYPGADSVHPCPMSALAGLQLLVHTNCQPQGLNIRL
jgi:hypothetical protein